MNIVSDIPLVQEILLISKAHKLKHIVISPGSRNAPIALSFANDNFFKCYSIVDERCAAFFALGIAQQTQEPVALLCTSGSALLNYYPAISEAFYSDVPLVVLSADRPKEFIDIGDGQTIRQEGVFKNHICFEANLENSTEYSEIQSLLNSKKINKAIEVSKQKKGPVHINIPLYEPLYNTTEKNITATNTNEIVKEASNFSLDENFKKLWNNSKKKLILVGVLAPNSIEEEVLNSLLDDPSVVVLTETTSNIVHEKAIPNIDMLIADFSEEEKKQFHPDILITFGGLIVSKKIKFLLREFQPKKGHFHIGEKTAYNTFGCLTQHFKTKPNLFFKEISLNKNLESNYQSNWLSFHSKLKEGHKRYMAEIPFSDLLVFHKILEKLPKNIHLQLSNSSTIRYTQLFQIPKGVEVFCNRGTSGIDGSTSTAIGASLIQNKETVFITGDLSFFYDSNALWNNYIPENFKIIVINNNGGGIFRILPGDKKADYFETFLETTHQMKVSNLARMYNFEYTLGDENKLNDQIERFFKSKKRQIFEISTPRQVNDVVLLNYFKKIRQ